MTAEGWHRMLQITGAMLGVPAAAAGTFAAYQSYFSTDVTCQKLRNDIIGIMERNVAPETKRSLLKKDVAECDKLCGGGAPRRAHHVAGRHGGTPCRGRARDGGSRRFAPAAAMGIARRVWRARLQGALRLGGHQPPSIGGLGANFHGICDLGDVVAPARHDLVGENHAAGVG